MSPSGEDSDTGGDGGDMLAWEIHRIEGKRKSSKMEKYFPNLYTTYNMYSTYVPRYAGSAKCA